MKKRLMATLIPILFVLVACQGIQEQTSEGIASNADIVLEEGVYPHGTAIPEKGSDGLYDLGFGQLLVYTPLFPLEVERVGVFAARPGRAVMVQPAQPDGWSHFKNYTVTYGTLKCEVLEPADPTGVNPDDAKGESCVLEK